MRFLSFLSNYRTPFGDTFWNLITRLGEGTTIIIILCIIYWCVNKKLGKILGYIFFMSSFLVQGIKLSFGTARPWVIDPSFKAVDFALEKATGYSFPSGHVQSSTSIFAGLAFYFRSRFLKIVLILVPLLVCFSRMYLGVHTPKDVIVAFALTAAIAFITIKYTKKYSRYQRIELMMISVFLGIILLGYTFILYSRKTVEVKYLIDSSKIIGAGFGFVLGNYLEGNFVKFRVRTIRIWEQGFKILLGLIGVGLLDKSFKLFSDLLGFDALIIYGLKYFILMIWIICLWPMIFKRILK